MNVEQSMCATSDPEARWNRLTVSLRAQGQETAGARSAGETRKVQLNLICKDDLTLHYEVNVLGLHRMAWRA